MQRGRAKRAAVLDLLLRRKTRGSLLILAEQRRAACRLAFFLTLSSLQAFTCSLLGRNSKPSTRRERARAERERVASESPSTRTLSERLRVRRAPLRRLAWRTPSAAAATAPAAGVSAAAAAGSRLRSGRTAAVAAGGTKERKQGQDRRQRQLHTSPRRRLVAGTSHSTSHLTSHLTSRSKDWSAPHTPSPRGRGLMGQASRRSCGGSPARGGRSSHRVGAPPGHGLHAGDSDDSDGDSDDSDGDSDDSVGDSHDSHGDSDDSDGDSDGSDSDSHDSDGDSDDSDGDSDDSDGDSDDSDGDSHTDKLALMPYVIKEGILRRG